MSRYASYCGREDCRSIGAQNAEADGKLPLTRAIPVVARRAGCTQAEAREALKATWSGEWHHTGNRARSTDYYDVDAAVRHLIGEERFDAEQRAIRLSDIRETLDRIARERDAVANWGFCDAETADCEAAAALPLLLAWQRDKLAAEIRGHQNEIRRLEKMMAAENLPDAGVKVGGLGYSQLAQAGAAKPTSFGIFQDALRFGSRVDARRNEQAERLAKLDAEATRLRSEAQEISGQDQAAVSRRPLEPERAAEESGETGAAVGESAA